MKSFRKINIFFLGLTLVFSLVSFSGNSTQPYSEVIKTALVVNDTKPDTRFSIRFQNVGNPIIPSFFNYTNYSFLTYQNAKNLIDQIAFNTYTHKTLSVLTEKRHTEFYSYYNNKILYMHFIV